MAYTRRIYTSRNSLMMGFPRAAADRMGVGRGSTVLISQPFSDTVIVEPVSAGALNQRSQSTRELGWIIGRMLPERDLAVFGTSKNVLGLDCQICGLWVSQYRVGDAQVCQFCAKEMACVIWLRSQPSQSELFLKHGSMKAGAPLPGGGQAPGPDGITMPE